MTGHYMIGGDLAESLLWYCIPFKKTAETCTHNQGLELKF